MTATLAPTAVRARSIIFTGESVRAVLDDRKTQTRRVVKLEPWMARAGMSLGSAWADPGLGAGAYLKVPGPEDTIHRLWCPFGQPGERLWVRETWWQAYRRVERSPGVVYRADYLRPTSLDPAIYDQKGMWRSPIHMPRWASRLTLEITGIRVERVQAISEEDAVAEGAADSAGGAMIKSEQFGITVPFAVYSFAGRWNALHAKRGYPWSSNPWVWVIEFRRVP